MNKKVKTSGNTAEEIKNKKKKNENRKAAFFDWFVKIAALLLLTIIVYWINRYKDTQEKSIEVKKVSCFQIFEDNRIDFDVELTFSTTGQISKLKTDEKNVDIEKFPIYYSDEKKLILPDEMAIVFPNRNGTMNRIRKYTTISDEWYATYLYSYEEGAKKEIDITNAFLYDGGNTYIFPSEVTIVVDDEAYDLSPLSYAILSYRESLELFDKESGKYTYIDLNKEEIEKDVIAENEDYKINLSTDILYVNNKEQLLLKKIKYLNYNKE